MWDATLLLVGKYLALYAGSFFLSLLILPLIDFPISKLGRTMHARGLKHLRKQYTFSREEWAMRERAGRIANVGYATSNGHARHHD